MTGEIPYLKLCDLNLRRLLSFSFQASHVLGKRVVEFFLLLGHLSIIHEKAPVAIGKILLGVLCNPPLVGRDVAHLAARVPFCAHEFAAYAEHVAWRGTELGPSVWAI